MKKERNASFRVTYTIKAICSDWINIPEVASQEDLLKEVAERYEKLDLSDYEVLEHDEVYEPLNDEARTIQASWMYKEANQLAGSVRVRKVDSDLRSYLYNNNDIYELEDIYNIHAEVPGHNDEEHWFWILELRDGRFVLTEASCDNSGWSCVSGGHSTLATSAEEAAMLAPENDRYSRHVQRNLLAQIRGEQPFGLEVLPYEGEE